MIGATRDNDCGRGPTVRSPWMSQTLGVIKSSLSALWTGSSRLQHGCHTHSRLLTHMSCFGVPGLKQSCVLGDGIGAHLSTGLHVVSPRSTSELRWPPRPPCSHSKPGLLCSEYWPSFLISLLQPRGALAGFSKCFIVVLNPLLPSSH